MRSAAILFLFMFYVSGISAQTGKYSVYALKFASAGERMPASVMALDANPKDSVNIDFSIWLIKGEDGRNILVDAGFRGDVEGAIDFKLNFYNRPDSVLMKMGLQGSDITDIIISHPHWDHIDGLPLFPNAKVWMQKEDYTYFAVGAWQKDGNHGGFDPRDVRIFTDLNLAGRLNLVDGDNKEIFPGITVFTGSKHTFNSQYVRVDTGKKKIILASDNIWIYYSLDHMVGPSKGGTLDNTAYVNAMKRMKTLASDPKLIIPGHDSRVFERFTQVKPGVALIQ